MRLVHRIVAAPAAALSLAAVGAVTTFGSAPAQAALVSVPHTGDRIEVTLTATETRLGASGQGVGAYVCSTYVGPASAFTAFRVDPVVCEVFVDHCADVARSAGGLAQASFLADRAQCSVVAMQTQPSDSEPVATGHATN